VAQPKNIGSFLTTTAAARLLRVTATRVRQFITQGRLKATRAGRDLFISADEIRRFLQMPRKRTGRP